MVVNKPAHMLVHPSKPGQIHTLLDELQQLLVYELANGAKISILNRLDRETSGLVLVTKRTEVARLLAKAWQKREFTKTYLAIVHGLPVDDRFSVKASICRKVDVEDSEINIQRMVHRSGKASHSDFEVIGRFGDVSLLKCRLQTGRTHQLRVHLEHVGHPIVGDKIYGHDGSPYLEFVKSGWTRALQNRLQISRHALHASGLEWGSHYWQAPFPEELREFLKKKGANDLTLP